MNHIQQEPIFFPVFLDLSSKKVVVVGGGSIAERRILTMYGFVGSITIIAPQITEKLLNLLEQDPGDAVSDTFSLNKNKQNKDAPLTDTRKNSMTSELTPVIWKQKTYERSDIMDADLVLACTSDPDLNNDIYVACKCLGILVNDCSDKNKCDFYFPSVVKKDNVVVGINGSGADHHQVKMVRRKIEQVLQCDHSFYQKDGTHSAGRDESLK